MKNTRWHTVAFWITLWMLVIPFAEAFPQNSEVSIKVQDPWTVAGQESDTIILQQSAAPTSFHVRWQAVDGASPGVSPWLPQSTPLSPKTPVVAWPYEDMPIQRVEIESDGPDVVIRFFGPPIREISNHPEAPDDPIILWTRIRYRGDNWRIVAKGVSNIHLPGKDFQGTLDHGDEWHLTTHQMGQWKLYSDSPAFRSTLSDTIFQFDTRPALTSHQQPYPTTRLTWYPSPLNFSGDLD